MRLFTVVFDYEGGTYVAQRRAKGISELVEVIDDVLPFDAMVPRPHKQVFVRSVEDATPIEGLENVWCVAGRIDGKLGLAHIVPTDVED